MTRIDCLALAALAPLIAGPLPSGEDTITARLCGGGNVSIPIQRKNDRPPGQPCFKACHAGPCRKRSDKGTTLEID